MNRSLGKWKLPQPTDLKDEDEKEWIQIPRIARTIPFGYVINKEDSELLDRVGLTKTEKVQVEASGGVMLLPPKKK